MILHVSSLRNNNRVNPTQLFWSFFQPSLELNGGPSSAGRILIRHECSIQILSKQLRSLFHKEKRIDYLTALVYLFKPPASLSETLNIIWHEHLLNVFELKCKWFFNGLGDLQSVTVDLFFLFFSLSFCACVSNTHTHTHDEN